jgi:hypothetical protein
MQTEVFDAFRKVEGPTLPSAQHVGGLSTVEVDCAAAEFSDGQQIDSDSGDDAEHRLAAPQTPEQIGVHVGGDTLDLHGTGDQSEGHTWSADSPKLHTKGPIPPPLR